MNIALNLAKILALLSLCTLCIVLSVVGLHTNKTLTKLDTTVTDVDATVKRTDLLVKNAQYLILQSGVTMNQVRLASIQESGMLDSVNSKMQKTLTDLDAFVLTSTQNETSLITTTNQTVAQLQPLILDARGTLVQSTATVASLQHVVDDPAIPATLLAAQKSAEASTGAMVAVKGTAEDVQVAVHSYLHPTWAHKIFGWTLSVVHALNPL